MGVQTQWGQVTVLQPCQPVVPALPSRATTLRQRLMSTLSAYHAGKGEWGVTPLCPMTQWRDMVSPFCNFTPVPSAIQHVYTHQPCFIVSWGGPHTAHLGHTPHGTMSLPCHHLHHTNIKAKLLCFHMSASLVTFPGLFHCSIGSFLPHISDQRG